MDRQKVVEGLLWFLAFLFSTTVHEAAHALAALKGGDPTAYEGGQVSLSPLPHIQREPIGMLLVPLITALTNGWAFGWASAPFDPRWAERYPRRAALMSAAGPLGNFSIAIVAWIGLRIGLGTGYFAPPELLGRFSEVLVAADGGNSVAVLLAKGLSVLLMLNVLLGTLNLLPLPPLDGSSAVLGLLPHSLIERASGIMRSPVFSLLGLVVAWQVFPQIAIPLFRMVASSFYPLG